MTGGPQAAARPERGAPCLSLLDDGTVALRLKRRGTVPPFRTALRCGDPPSDGATHVLLHAYELIGRIAALMPRPHLNSTLYSGVLAGAAAWRPHIVPARPPPDDSGPSSDPAADRSDDEPAHWEQDELDWAA